MAVLLTSLTPPLPGPSKTLTLLTSSLAFPESLETSLALGVLQAFQATQMADMAFFLQRTDRKNLVTRLPRHCQEQPTAGCLQAKQRPPASSGDTAQPWVSLFTAPE